MRGTTRDRNLAGANNVNTNKQTLVTHSWLPYSLLSILYICGAIGWFATMIATVAYSSSSGVTSVSNGSTAFVPSMQSAFFGFINLYLFRMICMFASLAIVYHAERHYLSRGWAWTSWCLNTLLVLSWVATDLPFVYSAFSYFRDGLANGYQVPGATNAAGSTGSNTNTGNSDTNAGLNQGFPDDSFRTHYCSVSSSYWCHLNYTHAVFSVFSDYLIGMAWIFACFQLKRARGVSNLLLTWAEVLLINLTVFGLVGYAIWTLSTINLGVTRQFGVFSYLEGQQQMNTYRMQWSNLVWGNYMIHAAIFVSLGSAAYVSFGATTAPRMSALILNWLSFMCIFPAFVYLARDLQEFSSCDGSQTSGRCPSTNGVAAGMGIVSAMNFLIGLTMFAVLAQAETADFAVDMYGDKARAIDDARSTGTLPMKDVAGPYDTTRPSTPEQNYRAGPMAAGAPVYNQAPLAGHNTGMMVNNGPAYAGAPIRRGEDVELGAPVY